VAVAETAKLIASLELKNLFSKEVANAEKSLNSLDKKLDQTQSRSYRAGQQIGHGLQNAAKLIATAVVSIGVLSAGVFAKAIKNASDLNETLQKVGVVFGAQRAKIDAFGKSAAAAMGLSENAADSAAATFGNLFVSMGFAQKRSADMSIALVKLAADLASFNNIDPSVALEKLQSGLTGQFRPLKELGINIDQAQIKQEAFRLGLIKTTKEAVTPAIKAQAAYALIFQQSKTAQGDFARTSTGLANQVRTLKANFDDLITTLGEAALPGVAKIFVRINAAIKSNQPAVKAFGDAIANLFSDANIEQGAKIVGNLFDTAKAAAPLVQKAAEATLFLVKSAVSLFSSLPDWVQQIAVGAFAVNKLTGGLVTNIGGGIADFVGQKLGLLRGSSPATPLFVSDVTGGIGGAAGAAGASEAGLLAKAFSLLPATFLAAGIIAAAVPIGQAFASALPDWLKGPGGQGMSESQTRILAARAAQNAGSPGLNTPLLDRGGREKGTPGIAGAIGGLLSRLVAIAKNGFGLMLAELRNAKTAKQIVAAVKEADRQINGLHKGSVAGTKDTVAGLRALLKKTSDPKLRADIKTALAKVQAKIPGREYAQKQIDKAQKLINDGKITQADTKSIKRIQADLRDHGLPHAASVIQASVDTASGQQVAASDRTTAAVKAQQVAVTVENAVTFSLRSLLNSQKTYQSATRGKKP
jgi:hypothetical protein